MMDKIKSAMGKYNPPVTAPAVVHPATMQTVKKMQTMVITGNPTSSVALRQIQSISAPTPHRRLEENQLNTVCGAILILSLPIVSHLSVIDTTLYQPATVLNLEAVVLPQLNQENQLNTLHESHNPFSRLGAYQNSVQSLGDPGDKGCQNNS